jgi:hypothetical protein
MKTEEYYHEMRHIEINLKMYLFADLKTESREGRILE